MEKIDTKELSPIEMRIFEILGDHKLREEEMTKMIHKQAEEIEKLRRELKAHKNDIDFSHRE